MWDPAEPNDYPDADGEDGDQDCGAIRNTAATQLSDQACDWTDAHPTNKPLAAACQYDDTSKTSFLYFADFLNPLLRAKCAKRGYSI